MKAMVLRRTGPVESNPLKLEIVQKPRPESDQALLKVNACGVCHTDLHTVEGDLPIRKPALVPGHQVVGIVEELGEGCETLTTGQRVGVTWFFSSCGKCSFCSKGKENLCDTAEFTGYHHDGGYAEYMVVPESSAFPIPDVFSDAEAVPLLCGGVIGYRSLRLSEIAPGESLGLYGFGNSAHIVIQIAVHMGCRVHVFTRSAKHRSLASDLGAVWTGMPDDVPPELMNSSIIFAPAGPLVPQALGTLAKGGTLALAGITMSAIPEMPYTLLYGERTVRSVANTTRRDAARLLEAAAAIPVRSVTEIFPLERANEVLTMMKHSALKAGAVLVPR